MSQPHSTEDAFDIGPGHMEIGKTEPHYDTNAMVVSMNAPYTHSLTSKPTLNVGSGVSGDGNPKTALGAKKPDLSVVPPSAELHMSLAMMNGAEKYGPFNWRDNKISARVYVAAARRHLLAYLDGEDFSADTVATGRPVHHLAHVMACCAILLDAGECGTLIDNRPTVKGRAGAMIEAYNDNQSFHGKG